MKNTQLRSSREIQPKQIAFTIDARLRNSCSRLPHQSMEHFNVQIVFVPYMMRRPKRIRMQLKRNQEHVMTPETEFELLLACYHSGQMTEGQWQLHLEDAAFAQWVTSRQTPVQPRISSNQIPMRKSTGLVRRAAHRRFHKVNQPVAKLPGKIFVRAR